jgi:hypothetical protein
VQYSNKTGDRSLNLPKSVSIGNTLSLFEISWTRDLDLEFLPPSPFCEILDPHKSLQPGSRCVPASRGAHQWLEVLAWFLRSVHITSHNVGIADRMCFATIETD